jgi:deazaflavin-dependent oxidoreductase (nitroreductase family)
MTFNQRVHKLLEAIASSRLLTWLTIHVIAPLDRRLLKASNGRLSLTGASTVLLVTTGAKSGATRYSSLPGLYHGERIILLASKGGAPTHPAWYYNLTKHPDVEIIKNGTRQRYRANTAAGAEREVLWAWLLEQWSGFAAYEIKARPRVLPIVVLSPASAPEPTSIKEACL